MIAGARRAQPGTGFVGRLVPRVAGFGQLDSGDRAPGTRSPQAPGRGAHFHGCTEVFALTIELPAQRLALRTMPRDQILAMIASGTEAERYIQLLRARLVPLALLQGAAALDVASALGNWTRDEFKWTVGRWAQDLSRRGLIAPAELDALLNVDITDVPQDPIRTLRR